MQFLSEVIFLFHYVGKALVRDVEEIDEGLYVSGLQQSSTDGLSVVVFMLIGYCLHGSNDLFEFVLVI